MLRTALKWRLAQSLRNMRVIFMRHGESQNNALKGKVNDAEYRKLRSHDADMSEMGVYDCISFG